MLDSNQVEKQGITTGFQHALNRHGFSFQYSVLKTIQELFEGKRSRWIFQAAEFPVAVRERNTHIDFILTRARDEWDNSQRHPETGVYLVGECKRADPALNRWCFARAPYVARNARKQFIVERIRIQWEGEIIRFRSGGSVLMHAFDSYHIGIEVKSGGKGDGSSGGRRAINEAATQVCEGLNGMVHYLFKSFQREGAGPPNGAIIIPVIFTTARLFTTEVDISSADIASGDIVLPQSSLQEKPWVGFQHSCSVGLKHEFDSLGDSTEISDVLIAEYIRSIPIVNAAGIETFLRDLQVDPEEIMCLKDCR